MTDPVVWRIRRAAVCAVLVATCFLQEPGRIVPDTKVDLTANPLGFLTRALTMWDPLGFGGQIQNQAYGYLFPIGPFFALGDLVGFPGWVTQRLWWGLILTLSFLGVARLAAALGIGGPFSQVLGALAFALSPRLLTTLGPISAEAWPMALSPWAVVPLVQSAHGRLALRRGALRSGAVVGLMGGVNATLALAAVLPAAVFLATRRPSRASARAAGWWAASAAAASLWWVGPLLLLGRYSSPFLDYIERAHDTTLPTSLLDSLRGASDWVAYLSPALGSMWRAGHDLVVDPRLILYTMLTAAIGLVGLGLGRLPERLWLVATLALGLVLVTLGHLGPLTPPWAPAVQNLLDGALAPLRNVHKFDVLIRLPLALGLAHATSALPSMFGRRAWLQPLSWGLLGATAICILGGSLPLLQGRLAPLGSYLEIPSYWRAAAAYVDDHPRGRTLLAPSARFALMGWGQPQDEPWQALATAPWDVRNAIPLVPTGHIRMLDAVDAALDTGVAAPGLPKFLADQGYGLVLLRSDLDWRAAGSVAPEVVRDVLRQTPGFSKVAGFGPTLGSASGDPTATASERVTNLVEIWAVDPSPRGTVAQPASSVTEVVGGPESLLDARLAGLDLGPAVLATDRSPSLVGNRVLVTDGLRRVEVDFGRSSNAVSATLDSQDRGTLGRRARDYLTTDDPAVQTTLAWEGTSGVTVSSSLAALAGFSGAIPGLGVRSAFDGSTDTAWLARDDDPRPTMTIALDAGSQATGQLRLTLPAGSASAVSDVEVIIDGQLTRTKVTGTEVTVPLPATPGRTVTIALVRRAGVSGPAGLAELELGGQRIRALLQMPSVDAGGRGVGVLLTALRGDQGCVGPLEDTSCSAALIRPGEEDAGLERRFDLTGADGRLTVRATAVARDGPGVTSAIARGARWSFTAAASSSLVPAARGGALAAVDGDRATVWTAGPFDLHPALTLRFARPTEVSRIELVPPGGRASRATSIQVTIGDRTFQRTVHADGVVTFPATSASTLRIDLLSATRTPQVDAHSGQAEVPPVGLADVLVSGAVNPPAAPDLQVALPCGQGPTITVDGRKIRTSVTTTVDDLLTGAAVAAQPCDEAPVLLASGTYRVSAPSTSDWTVAQVALLDGTWGAAGGADPVSVSAAQVPEGSATTRLPARVEPTVVAMAENANDGWSSTTSGARAVTVDGWQQGFVVPAGASDHWGVTFSPDAAYRLCLLLGLVAAVALAGALVADRRAGPTQVRLRPLRPGNALLWGALGILLLALVGWLGLGAVVVVFILRTMAARTRLTHLGVGLAAAVLLAGAVLAATAPWGSSAHDGRVGATQALALLAVALVCGGGVQTPPRPRAARHGTRHAVQQPRQRNADAERDDQH